MDAVNDLIKAHGSGRKAREVLGEMFAIVGEADESERAILEPIVAQFFDTQQWFMKKTHLGVKLPNLPEEAELVQKFKQFDRIVLSLFREFFKTAGELHELIQEANARAD